MAGELAVLVVPDHSLHGGVHYPTVLQRRDQSLRSREHSGERRGAGLGEPRLLCGKRLLVGLSFVANDGETPRYNLGVVASTVASQLLLHRADLSRSIHRCHIEQEMKMIPVFFLLHWMPQTLSNCIWCAQYEVFKYRKTQV